MGIEAEVLSNTLIGGMSRAELPIEANGVLTAILEPQDFILPPLPNHLFTRDTSCWIYEGVTLNPMRWNARRLETLNIAAIYRFHPAFRASAFPVSWRDPARDPGPANCGGGDSIPIANCHVLNGMGRHKH